MKINRKLNLVVPVTQDSGQTVYVHSMPLAREVFEKYFLVIAKAFSSIYSEGLGIVGGPRVAAHLLRRVAMSMNALEGPEGVELGLMAEIRRLSNIIALGPHGWDYVPLQEAFDKGLMDEDDRSEVENAIAFFIVASCMHKKAELEEFLKEAAKLWGAQITSSNCTEFAASLPTSTPAANTGVTATQSSIPS